jgi:stage V sporulation protein AE
MIFFWAFVVGGAICLCGQLCYDVLRISPAHTMTLLVVTGALVDGIIIDGMSVYDRLIAFAGAGASVPITSFGSALVHGALSELNTHGAIGVLTGIFEVTSAGISAALIFSLCAALLVKPKA